MCVHNALEHVERCLASVLTRTTVEFRLIVVNDGSDEPTTVRLRELAADHAEMEVVETSCEQTPIGYAGAANRGLRHGSADYVVLLNSDTIVPRLWIEGLLDRHVERRQRWAWSARFPTRPVGSRCPSFRTPTAGR